MCLNHDIALECTVGDLVGGDKFRDPDGNTYLIADDHLIVNIETGAIFSTLDWVESANTYRKDIKLGRDSQGRLYAARKLNGWKHGTNPMSPVPPAGTDRQDGDDPAILMADNNG